MSKYICIGILEGDATTKAWELVHGTLGARGPLDQLELIGRAFGPRKLLVATQYARHYRFLFPLFPQGY